MPSLRVILSESEGSLVPSSARTSERFLAEPVPSEVEGLGMTKQDLKNA